MRLAICDQCGEHITLPNAIQIVPPVDQNTRRHIDLCSWKCCATYTTNIHQTPPDEHPPTCKQNVSHLSTRGVNRKRYTERKPMIPCQHCHTTIEYHQQQWVHTAGNHYSCLTEIDGLSLPLLTPDGNFTVAEPQITQTQTV